MLLKLSRWLKCRAKVNRDPNRWDHVLEIEEPVSIVGKWTIGVTIVHIRNVHTVVHQESTNRETE